MAVPGSHVMLLLLALFVGGARAYYDPGEQLDSRLTDGDSQSSSSSSEEESPYLLHRVTGAEGRQGGGWGPAPDPRLYVLTEGGDADDYEDNDQLSPSPLRAKRNSRPMLSIYNNMDVLRQRLLLEMARRRMSESRDANREILKSIGKRGVGQGQGQGGADGSGRTNSGTSFSVKRGKHQQQL